MATVEFNASKDFIMGCQTIQEWELVNYYCIVNGMPQLVIREHREDEFEQVVEEIGRHRYGLVRLTRILIMLKPKSPALFELIQYMSKQDKISNKIANRMCELYDEIMPLSQYILDWANNRNNTSSTILKNKFTINIDIDL